MISLKVNNLTKSYNRKKVLENLNFEHTNGILGIGGSNGSGKSTLLKCLAYLLRPSSGDFSWFENGTSIKKADVRANLGYAAPYLNLYEDLTLLENLMFLSDLSESNHTEEYFSNLLTKVQLQGFEQRLFKSLSTGQQQRVKLAVSLLRNPKILLLDEPGSNLDIKGNKLVAEIVNEQHRKNCLVIIASNSAEELELCHNIIRLN